MNKFACRFALVTIALLVLAFALPDHDSSARVGGGSSYGSRGSRSYSPPSRSYSPTAPTSPSAQFPRSTPAATGGGFLRSMAGGMLGGFLGGMLFRGLGFGGGYGGFGGGGIGLFEIILLAGIGYLIYRLVAAKRKEQPYPSNTYERTDYQAPVPITPQWQQEAAPESVDTGLSHIRQMDGSFDEGRFKDLVMDMFFRIQGAWMNRNLSSVSTILADEIRREMQKDVDQLLREKRINKLENIAVRNVAIAEAWQENGHDFITVLIFANLLDYTTAEASGAITAGSNVEPVKFEEYWTFTRPVGNNAWRLTAINQI